MRAAGRRLADALILVRSAVPVRPRSGSVSRPDSAVADFADGRFVTSDNTVLRVRESVVDGYRPTDPTVVLVHGWTLDLTAWERVVPLLCGRVRRPVRVLRYDHRGHGRSTAAAAGTATLAQAADDLRELISALVPQGPVVLAGHSMGGMVIMALAEQHPELVAERVAAIALVATSSGGLSDLTFGLPRWLAARVASLERRFNRQLAARRRPALFARSRLARAGLRWLLFGDHPARADIAVTAAQVGRCDPASMVGFRDSLSGHERREALAVLRGKPAVVLAGGADRLLPVPHAKVIADELPDADFVVFPRAGHILALERDHEVAERIARLVNSLQW